MSSRTPPDETAPRVFLSVTSPTRPAQGAFVVAIASAVADHGMTPVRLTSDRWSFETPLEPIRRLMRSCEGTIVIALARNHVLEGIEYTHQQEGHRYRDRYLATEWVQIEAAIAYQLDHPILVLREDRVHQSGLLDPATSGVPVYTFSLSGSGTEDLPNIAQRLSEFRARLASTGYGPSATGSRK